MDFLARYDASFARAREILVRAFETPDPGPAARLFRWIAAQDVNPWSVFSDPEFARALTTAEGAAGVLEALELALQEPGSICFPLTAAHGPRIALMDRNSSSSEAEFLSQIARHGHGEDVIQSHAVQGFCEDIDGFMAAFEAHLEENRKAFEDFLNPEL